MPNGVIEITEQDIDLLYDLVGKAMEESLVTGGVSDSMFSQKLFARSIKFAQDRMKRQINPECRTDFNSNGMEYRVWALGLLTMDWAVEILRKKTRDGHCYTHKSETSQPCDRAKPFQESIYRSCIASFEKLLAELEERPIDYPEQK